MRNPSIQRALKINLKENKRRRKGGGEGGMERVHPTLFVILITLVLLMRPYLLGCNEKFPEQECRTNS